MIAAELMAALQADRPVYIFIEGSAPIPITEVALGCVEQVVDTTLGWCRDDTHPFSEVVNVLKTKSRAVAHAAPGFGLSNSGET